MDLRALWMFCSQRRDVVFKCRRVCERIRYGPVFFGDIDGDKVVLLVEDAC